MVNSIEPSNYRWKGVFRYYKRKTFYKSLKRPVYLFIPVAIISCWMDIDPGDGIKTICNIITSGFPSLIGFIIAGYALFIGISSLDLLKALTKTFNSGKSLYLTVSSSFSIILLALITTYLIGCVCTVFTSSIYFVPSYIPLELIGAVNCIVFLIITFCLIYCVFALYDVVINIYNYSVYINHFVQVKTEKDGNKNNIGLCRKICMLLDCLKEKISKLECD